MLLKNETFSGEIIVDFLTVCDIAWHSVFQMPAPDIGETYMKKVWIAVCLVLVLSFAVLQQMTYSKVKAGTSVCSSAATAARGQNSCIQQCAQARDNCRTNACVSVGGHPDTAQACRDVPPERTNEFNQKVQACFDQEKKCDKGCPSTLGLGPFGQ